MGLASALTTALTGLTAAETQIDVIGNNLANSQTVGFKASDTVFASQFLQTHSLGSAPTADSGGTNPRQIGLGVQVAEITPDFSQGTIQASSNPSDLALQGDGMFIVEGLGGEQLYTRNGIFRLNSQNELVSVTGHRLLGYGVDDNFQILQTQLVPLDLPIGSSAVAQATQTAFLEGTLTPTGDVADTAQVVQSAVMGDNRVPRADASSVQMGIAATPDETGTTLTGSAAGGLNAGSTYEYRFVFADAAGSESTASGILNLALGAGEGTITINGLPSSPGAPPDYNLVNVYRRESGVETDFHLIGQAAEGAASFVDNGIVSGAALDSTSLTGNYSYVITYYATGQEESRPSLLIGPENTTNGRLRLANLPTPPVPGPGDNFPAYDEIRIYRNLATDPSNFYLVDTVSPGDSYTDSKSDAEISDLTIPGNQMVDLDGPKIDSNTLLTDVLVRDGLNYQQAFTEGSLSFTGRKGDQLLASKNFTVTATSTVQELVDFLEDATGVLPASGDLQNPTPGSVNQIPGESGSLASGGQVIDGRIRFVSNNGVDNAVSIGLSAFQLTDLNQDITTPNLGFDTIQQAQGQSASADMIVYDSLGIPLDVRITTVLESRTGSETVYRWFADSPDNDPLSGADVSVGTGLIRFDSSGNLINASNSTVTIERRSIASATPLQLELDFSQLSGLAQDQPTLAVARQDGFPTGTLASFTIGEDGVIRGSFTNGVTRDLGQIRLARFSNPSGLRQQGLNLFASGPNSGLPVEGNAGDNGLATILAGSLELSNSDVGQNLVDLVLATTMYRGNTRVISSAQQLLDELLNLRR